MLKHTGVLELLQPKLVEGVLLPLVPEVDVVDAQELPGRGCGMAPSGSSLGTELGNSQHRPIVGLAERNDVKNFDRIPAKG